MTYLLEELRTTFADADPECKQVELVDTFTHHIKHQYGTPGTSTKVVPFKRAVPFCTKPSHAEEKAKK
ncbi:hypothetical protein DPX16_16655 [Anabarilius grahami]|uniref:Uncharacterized protein n=1 Tax=Anabarilius grahami TaxID=495550 RepID=A0A3N0YSP9_ANAGA|nr:hypothetical protein DPX16_16655 [Anabarilius grahami]